MATPAKRRNPRRAPRKPPTAPGLKAAASARPTHDDVAARAYELFVRRGGEHGQDWEDWLLAERELGTSGSREKRSVDPPDYAG
jgi:hypothetical protein